MEVNSPNQNNDIIQIIISSPTSATSLTLRSSGTRRRGHGAAPPDTPADEGKEPCLPGMSFLPYSAKDYPAFVVADFRGNSPGYSIVLLY